MNNFNWYMYYVLGRLRSLYFMQIPEGNKDFKQSRRLSSFEALSAQVIIQMSGGAYLASLLGILGISDSFNGIISSFSSLLTVFQLLGFKISSKIKKTKLFVALIAIISRLMFAGLYFIPFLNIPPQYKIGLFIFAFVTATIFLQIISPAASDWLASLVPQRVRGKYLSIRDVVSVLGSAVVILIAGRIIDVFKAVGKNETGFIIAGCIALCAAIANFLCFSFMKEPKVSYTDKDNKEMHGRIVKRAVSANDLANKQNTLQIIKNVFTDKRFNKVILLTVLWQISLFLSSPYLSIYQISELKLSYSYITAFVVIAGVVRMILTPKWGKFADRKSWAITMKYALIIVGAAHLVNVFTHPSNGQILFAVFSIINSIGGSALWVALFAIQFDYAPNENRTAYLAVNATIMGLCGFLSSLIGAGILGYIQHHNLIVSGITIYGQQILSLISGIIMLCNAMYVYFIIQPMKALQNTQDGHGR